MRQNRLSQRLKSKLDSFGFDALIKGVSTLVEEPLAEEALKPEEPAIEVETKGTAAAIQAPAEVVPAEMSSGLLTVEALLDLDEPAVATEPGDSFLAPETARLADGRRRTAVPSATAVLDVEPEARPVPAEPVSEPVVEKPRVAPEPLRQALHSLSCRLTQEVGRMAAALRGRDAEEAGFYLAHVNQILELLHTLDARGDIARQLGVENPPPAGRAWPLTAWTVVEFAESPFSALLPPDAGETFVREVIYAAWGISFSNA